MSNLFKCDECGENIKYFRSIDKWLHMQGWVAFDTDHEPAPPTPVAKEN